MVLIIIKCHFSNFKLHIQYISNLIQYITNSINLKIKSINHTSIFKFNHLTTETSISGVVLQGCTWICRLLLSLYTWPEANSIKRVANWLEVKDEMEICDSLRSFDQVLGAGFRGAESSSEPSPSSMSIFAISVN